jgi:hypothetical protein
LAHLTVRQFASILADPLLQRQRDERGVRTEADLVQDVMVRECFKPADRE